MAEDRFAGGGKTHVHGQRDLTPSALGPSLNFGNGHFRHVPEAFADRRGKTKADAYASSSNSCDRGSFRDLSAGDDADECDSRIKPEFETFVIGISHNFADPAQYVFVGCQTPLHANKSVSFELSEAGGVA
jgi:hypothetical protein